MLIIQHKKNKLRIVNSTRCRYNVSVFDVKNQAAFDVYERDAKFTEISQKRYGL